MKKTLATTALWVALAADAVFAQLGIGGPCHVGGWCNCTMETHMFSLWCGGSGFGSWCYNSNHYCRWNSW